MLEQLEGSKAVARTVGLCRAEVIPAYPISPQTHIVEALSAMVKSGELAPCEFVNVESEFAAMSVAIGASATGARTYTATASQGLLYMAEALYNASGLGLPIVMTVANRAIGAPINIWNDHSDSMSQRDSGWLQLYVESNQEAVDTHILAFRLAEELSQPVMVCMDGFILTHAFEQVDIPSPVQVDSFLPPYEPRQVLDPDEPITIGAMVGTEAFTEVKYLAHLKQMQALDLIPELAEELGRALGREPVGLLRSYRVYDAHTIVVALGSVMGTIEDAVDELRARGVSVGAVAIKAFRPFPLAEVRAALGHARRVVVIEKAFAVGLGGIVSQNVRNALEHDAPRAPRTHALGDALVPGRGGDALVSNPGTDALVPDPAAPAPHRPPVHTVIAGLGGRPITQSSLVRLLGEAAESGLPQMSFLDLNTALVERELQRTRERRRSGPHAENMLRDVGAVAAGPV